MPCHICTSANHSFLACPSFDPVNNTRPTRTPSGNISMTALSSSSASPPPVSPSPHESPQAASTTTRKKSQPYRKKETVDEAILVYTALRQRVSLGEILTKALREAGISYPTFQHLHRPLGEASVLIPSSVANIGLVRAFKVIKGVSAELQKVPEYQRKEATDAGLII